MDLLRIALYEKNNALLGYYVPAVVGHCRKKEVLSGERTLTPPLPPVSASHRQPSWVPSPSETATPRFPEEPLPAGETECSGYRSSGRPSRRSPARCQPKSHLSRLRFQWPPKPI